MISIDAVGLAAGFLTTVAFLPQIFRILKTRSAHDVSFGMILLYFMGIGLWLLYGIRTRSVPIIITNCVTICLVSVLLICKLKYRDHTSRPSGGV